MHVSKQKDRLPYHSIFYPDYLVFYSSESSATNSLSQSPLTNVFPINATQTGSLMNFGSQPFQNSVFRGLVRGARLAGGGRKHPWFWGTWSNQRQAAQATWPQTPQMVCQGRPHRTGTGVLAAAGAAHRPEAQSAERPMTMKRTSHRAASARVSSEYWLSSSFVQGLGLSTEGMRMLQPRS